MCSYQVWIKRGCPESLVRSASSQELLLQTLHLQYIVLQSLPRLNGMFCCHDEAGCVASMPDTDHLVRDRVSAASPLFI